MSYYKDFCGPSKKDGSRAFLVLVNCHGEMVVHRLDKDGKSLSFSCGDAADMFREMLQEQHPGAKVVVGRTNHAPWQFVSSVWKSKPKTFAEVVELLNGKKQSTGRAIATYVVYHTLWASFYITWDDEANRWSLTEKAKKADEAKKRA